MCRYYQCLQKRISLPLPCISKLVVPSKLCNDDLYISIWWLDDHIAFVSLTKTICSTRWYDLYIWSHPIPSIPFQSSYTPVMWISCKYYAYKHWADIVISQSHLCDIVTANQCMTGSWCPGSYDSFWLVKKDPCALYFVLSEWFLLGKYFLCSGDIISCCSN